MIAFFRRCVARRSATARSRALDDVVGRVVVALLDGTEFRQALQHPRQGATHVTPDGRTWVAVREGLPTGTTIDTPFTIHWRRPVAPHPVTPVCVTSAAPPSPATKMAAGASIAQGPNLPCSPRTVRLNFHVMQKADGSGNFPNDATAPPIFAQVMNWLNGMFAFLGRSSLPSYTAFIPDSKIRFRLVNVYFHPDNAGWQLNHGSFPPECDTYWYNNFGVNKGREINVFFLGESSASIGACAVSIPSLFLNMGGSYSGSNPIMYWVTTQMLAHELAHCLGLYHTFPVDSIADTPPETSWGWLFANATTTGNNIAGYDVDRNFLSRLQLEEMHGLLRSSFSSVRDITLVPTPRGLANAYAPPWRFGAEGFWGVDVEGDLVRASWAGRWNLQTIPSPDFKIVPGSLVSETGLSGRVYGVNDRYEIVKTDTTDTSPVVIGGPGVTPGSLVDGLSGDVYAVDLSGQFVRVVVASGVSSTFISSPTMAAGSLVSTNWGGVIRVFGVSEGYGIYVTSGLFVNSLGGTSMVDAVPGSLIDGGATFGLFGVDRNTNVVNIPPLLSPPATYSASAVGGIQPGSLVLQSVSHEVYGVTPAGRIVLVMDASGFPFTPSPSSIPGVVPGSLVDGFANGLFGVTPGGDILRVSRSGAVWTSDLIVHWGANVVSGALISLADIDNGRAYGVTESGQICGTWNNGGVLQYSIIE